jgi:DNA-binding MarR family transcriptional regulator
LKLVNRFFRQFALLFDMATPNNPILAEAAWRQTHLGRLLGHALRRFDDRVLTLMAQDPEVPLALSNLAERRQVSAAHIHITRHLAQTGTRLTELARQAGMSKQAMGDLVDQCEAWGLVERASDSRDRRARLVRFTATGLLWLQAFERAVRQAEAEFRQAVGAEIATVVALGLEAYGQGYAVPA